MTRHDALTKRHKSLEMVAQALFEGLTSPELRIALSRRLSRPISDPTYRRWRQDSGVGSKDEYSSEDLDVLTVYAIALLRRRSKPYALSKVVEYLINEHQSPQDPATATIDVDAAAV